MFANLFRSKSGRQRRKAGASHKTLRARRAQFEPLEQRMLLSVSAGGHFDDPMARITACNLTHSEPSNEPHEIGDEHLEIVSEPFGDTPGGMALAQVAPLAALNPLDSMPLLHSNPGAPVSVFLDFNGHSGSSYGGSGYTTTPVYDTDGDYTTFSDTELDNIQQAWARVAEDFAPFEIDVTTEEPAVLAEGVPIDQSAGVALRVAIGGTSDDWYGHSAAGVAMIGTFTSSFYNLVYVFADKMNAFHVGEIASHEAGHGLWLYHQSRYDEDGVKTQEYSTGGDDWTPLMGFRYAGKTSIWHNGTSSQGPDVYQDDLAILTGERNGISYRADDHADGLTGATPLTPSGTTWTGQGIIETNDDVDTFSFTTQGDRIRLTVDVHELAPNLDAVVNLLDENGELIVSAAPSETLSAVTFQTLAAGTYYVQVTKPAQYGLIGTYNVKAEVISRGPYVVDAGPSGVLATDSVSSVRVEFEEAVDPASFEPTDVVLTGPTGPIPVASINPVAGSDNRQFDISFATQTGAGPYNLIIGPDIQDPGGYSMNQDQDTIAGELGEDTFTVDFNMLGFSPGWAVQSGGIGSDYAYSVAVAPDGALYQGGQFNGTSDLDPGPGVALLTSAGSWDAYVAKFTPNGQLAWAKRFGGADGYTRVCEVVTDDLGQVYTTGNFTSPSVDFGATTLLLPEGATRQCYVAKLDSEGNVLWAVNTGNDSSLNYGLVVDADGNVYSSGGFENTVDFDPGAGVHELTSAGLADGYVLKLNSDGDFIWVVPMTGANDVSSDGLAIDGAGSVYAVGHYKESVQFGTLAPVGTLDDSATSFLFKLDTDGNSIWVNHLESYETSAHHRVVADGTNSVYTATRFRGDTDFDSLNTHVGDIDKLYSDVTSSALVKYDADGNLLWVSPCLSSTSNSNLPYALAVDSDGAPHMAGYFQGEADFDPGPTTANRLSLGLSDAYVVKLDPQGNMIWNYQLGGTGIDQAKGVAVAADGDVFVTGYSSETAYSPTGELLSSNGGSDIFLLKLAVGPGIFVSAASGLQTDEDGGTSQFDVKLESRPNTPVTINVTSRNTAEGLVSTLASGAPAESVALVFTPENWKTAQTVIVTGVADSVFDNPAAFDIDVSVAPGSDAEYLGFGPFNVSAVNLNTDPAPVLFADSFENGPWNGNWVEDSQDDWFTSSQRATDGGFSAEVDGKASDATLGLANPIDTRAYGSAELTFDWYLGSDFDPGEYLALDFSGNGSTWTEVARLSGDVDTEDVWHSETVAVDPAFLTGAFEFRFRAAVSHSREDANVDNVKLIATSLAGPPNGLPVAHDDGATTTEDNAVLVDVLGNDSDPDGQTLTVVSVTQGTFGTVTVNADNSVTYDPNTDASGPDTFTYTITDNNGGTDTATVTVEVTPVADAPIADAGGPYTVAPGETVLLDASGSTDADLPYGDALTYAWDLDNDGTYETAGATATFSSATVDQYTIGLQVTDSTGLIGTASTTVTVQAAPSEYIYTSTGDPITIGDNKTISSSIAISGTGASIASLTININLTHASYSDLTARLITSTGSTINLATPILPGDYVIDAAGLPLDGTWTLQITDSVKNRKRGTLIDWTMTAQPAPALPAASSEAADLALMAWAEPDGAAEEEGDPLDSPTLVDLALMGM